MAWAEVADLRALIYTDMTDDELSDILNLAQDSIEIQTGNIILPNNLHKMACLYKAAVFLLQRQKTNGELAYTSKVGGIHQINEIDKMIASYESRASSLITSISLKNLNNGAVYGLIKPLFRDDPNG